MTYDEILKEARTCIGQYCKACPVCNGKACKNQIPGPGAKGVGDTAIRNYDKWQEIRVNMDTICAGGNVDTSLELFGKTFRFPFFAGPVGAVNLHYGDKYNDQSYNDVLVSACADAGIAALTGDGVDANVMKFACEAIKKADGMGSKSVEELHEIVTMNDVPFIVKGVMTVKGALKAVEAGADAIVVSNHGGRVLDQCPATVEVLPEIVDAVKGKMKIFVDGGIRSGTDVFKALALGADGVLICRPFVTAVFGGGTEGVRTYIEKIGAELADTMEMCGARSLGEITRDMVRM